MALQLTKQKKMGPPQTTLTLAKKCVLNCKGVFLHEYCLTIILSIHRTIETMYNN